MIGKKKKCDNCDRLLKDTIPINLKDGKGGYWQFCTTACYIIGMKKRGLYNDIKKAAIRRHNKDFSK